MPRSWFEFQANSKVPEILIFDEIGSFGASAKDFNTELKDLGQVPQIKVRINSPGGSVFDGSAIYNMLRDHPARIEVVIEGIAASTASMIAMAGDEVVMPENAMLMIHDPSGAVMGNSRSMRELAEALDKVKSTMVTAYANKSGQARETIEQLMSDEVWLTADEALELGFCDRIKDAIKMAAQFDLHRFKHAPKQFDAWAWHDAVWDRWNGRAPDANV